MADIEKVIEELEDIQKHLDTGYSFAISWKSELIRNALELLKDYRQHLQNDLEILKDRNCEERGCD